VLCWAEFAAEWFGLVAKSSGQVKSTNGDRSALSIIPSTKKLPSPSKLGFRHSTTRVCVTMSTQLTCPYLAVTEVWVRQATDWKNLRYGESELR
jgi:hypothetical protein